MHGARHETEPRMPVFEYPPYDFEVTEDLTNLDLFGDADEKRAPLTGRPASTSS